MSVQISTGVRSLVALGLGIGDVATIFTLGHRVGNWITASSGDVDFLALLDQDEMTFLTRRGTMDMAQFNKRWGKAMHLLINGKPQTLYGEKAEKAMGHFSRFTAAMVCITTALDGFAAPQTVKMVLTRVLKDLLRTTEYGEEVLASQISGRLNSWRSAGMVRGLSSESRALRGDLLRKKVIVDGLMPAGEASEMAEFLTWLLAGDSEEYVTNSSDVAGVATCLSKLGFTILSIRGLGDDSYETSCTLNYTPASFLHNKNQRLKDGSERLRRAPSSTISLAQLHESLTLFPIDPQTANKCRSAWNAGSRAAKYVDVQNGIPTVEYAALGGDFQYWIVDNGDDVGRVNTEIHDLVEAHALAVNQQLCDAAASVLGGEAEKDLQWLNDQTTGRVSPQNHISNHSMTDYSLIKLFTRFQAFFMGYYYDIFLRLVDTSSLQVQSVDGNWGFRSVDLLTYIRQQVLLKSRKRQREPKTSSSNNAPQWQVLFRQEVLEILSRLLLSYDVTISALGRHSWCLGVVSKRALLVKSLVSPCHTPKDIGSFILLDVDVGGVPTDNEGLIRPGIAEGLLMEVVEKPAGRKIELRGPEEDLTKHIEADWSGNPETALLCIRYKGRRLATINPNIADAHFCMAYVDPIEEPKPQSIENALECGIQDFVDGRTVLSSDYDIPVVVQSYGNPIMRYAAVGLYKKGNLKLASNCVHAALAASSAHITSTVGVARAAMSTIVVVA